MGVPHWNRPITFSDGYAGVCQRALPELTERGIPFVVFVRTGHVGSSSARPRVTWERLRTLDRSGLRRVESQTVSRPADLTRVSAKALRREFLDSKATLERELAGEVSALAEPNGKFDERVARLAREAGYRPAFTEERTPAEASPDLWRIGRYLHTRVPKLGGAPSGRLARHLFSRKPGGGPGGRLPDPLPAEDVRQRGEA